MPFLNMKKKCKIDLNLEFDTEISSNEVVLIVSDVLKFILFQRHQIPMPIDVLEKQLTTIKASKSHDHQQKENETAKERAATHRSSRRKEKWLDKVSKFITSYEDTFKILSDQISSDSIEQIQIIIGSTVYSGKEVYNIKLPEKYQFQLSKNMPGRKISLQLCRSLMMNEELMNLVDIPCSCAKIWLLVKKKHHPTHEVNSKIFPRIGFMPSIRSKEINLSILPNPVHTYSSLSCGFIKNKRNSFGRSSEMTPMNKNREGRNRKGNNVKTILYKTPSWKDRRRHISSGKPCINEELPELMELENAPRNPQNVGPSNVSNNELNEIKIPNKEEVDNLTSNRNNNTFKTPFLKSTVSNHFGDIMNNQKSIHTLSTPMNNKQSGRYNFESIDMEETPIVCQSLSTPIIHKQLDRYDIIESVDMEETPIVSNSLLHQNELSNKLNSKTNKLDRPKCMRSILYKTPTCKERTTVVHFSSVKNSKSQNDECSRNFIGSSISTLYTPLVSKLDSTELIAMEETPIVTKNFFNMASTSADLIEDLSNLSITDNMESVWFQISTPILSLKNLTL